MVADNDYELLEAYLDDELSAGEVESLSRRLADESALATALEELRCQRATRVAMWQSLEPASAEEFTRQVIRSARRQRVMMTAARIARAISAAAACVMVGGVLGWYLRGHDSKAIAPSPVVAVSHESGRAFEAPDLPAGAYQVALTDEKGNVLAVQKFNKLEEAQQFAQDLGQVEERQRDVQDGKVVLVSDHF